MIEQIREISQYITSAIVVLVMTILQFIVIGTFEAGFTVSGWLFGFAVAFWIKKDNTIINSILLGGFSLLSFVSALSFLNGIFYDLLHIFPVIVSLFLLYEGRSFRFLYILISSIIMAVWGAFVFLWGIAYQYMSFEMLIAFFFLILMNLFLFYGLSRILSQRGESKKISYQVK